MVLHGLFISDHYVNTCGVVYSAGWRGLHYVSRSEVYGISGFSRSLFLAHHTCSVPGQVPPFSYSRLLLIHPPVPGNKGVGERRHPRVSTLVLIIQSLSLKAVFTLHTQTHRQLPHHLYTYLYPVAPMNDSVSAISYSVATANYLLCTINNSVRTTLLKR